MKLLIVGGKGMLGSDLADACTARGIEFIIRDLPEMDICSLENVRQGLAPCDAVINCAAFTRVDDAEKERDAAMAINADGARNVAIACAEKDLWLLHLSTDYVFDGTKGRPCVEDDPVKPLNFYGLTKLKGEEGVRSAGGQNLIVRTQSLYGLRGRNFIKAILGKIRSGQKSLRVVNDQVSSPTYTRHLAEALLRLVPLRKTGVVHVASSGSCSWFDFARAIVERVKPGVEVQPITTAELNFPALRPAYSVLDTTRYSAWTGHAMPTWQQGLDAYLAEEKI